jgi:mannose/fructose/N-acetylgalactosamine-specific phosphotransferase system component IIC
MSSNIDVISTIFSVHQGYNITGAIPIGIIGIFFLNLAYTFAYVDPLDKTKKRKSPNFSNIVLICLVLGSICFYIGISNTMGWSNYLKK